jgi:hypothetical protein
MKNLFLQFSVLQVAAHKKNKQVGLQRSTAL